jgi:alpha-1,3-rhamnosyl/mannosyltransferase
MIRVAIETNALYIARTGVSRYIQGLLQGLHEVQPSDVSFYELAWPVENFHYRQPQRALKTAYRELFWARCLAPSLVRRQGTQVVHSTSGGLISMPPGLPEVITLHDLALIRHPQRYRPWQLWSGKRRYPRLHRARLIICVSRFTANEATELLGLPSSRMRVIHHGCDFGDRHPHPCALPRDLEVPAEFFIFVGSLEPGKNLALLRQTYQLAAKNDVSLPALLIVGTRWPGVGTEGPPPANWHYLGRQSDEVLASLYRRAIALLFPSKYEGFGFPILEAMSQDCPVICSQVASLPEVGGDAVHYAEQTPSAYLEAMLVLWCQPASRMRWIELGRQQYRRFTWRHCAEITLEVYREAARAEH